MKVNSPNKRRSMMIHRQSKVTCFLESTLLLLPAIYQAISFYHVDEHRK